MSDVFISYSRAIEPRARQVAEALAALGYSVWRDDQLPAHKAYTDVTEERLRAAKSVLVIWSAEAVKSQWVRAEAEVAREAQTLVQLSLDGAIPPLPFNQIQCADMNGWQGEADAPGWKKVLASIAELTGGAAPAAPPAPPLALPSKPSIAVMPFANLSGDPEQDYFADGMVEEIVAALTRNRSLFVIASSSTSAFKGKAVSPPDVARQLGVRYLLEGSVRKGAGRVRVAVSLLEAASGVQIWADRFDDTLDDIFALQDQVALSVAGIIEPAVEVAEVRRVSQRPTENMGSYDLYLRALPLFWNFAREPMAEALALLDRAVELDPDFGLALALASTCHRLTIDFAWSDDPQSHHAKGLARAHRALGLAGNDARALAHAASALMGLDPNLQRATDVTRQALAMNPGCAYAWLVSGLLHTRLGEPDVAIAHMERAIRLDPLSGVRVMARFNTGLAHLQQGRFAEALPLLQASMTAVTPLHRSITAAVFGHLGMTGEAQKALAEFYALGAVSTDDVARIWFRKPEQRKLFVDGIAMAEGKLPADAPASG